MAHIANFMVDTTSSIVGLNNYIARELSPHSAHDATNEGSPPAVDETEKEQYIWRMHQPTEPRKYQLFPAFEKLPLAVAVKSPESETSSGMASVGSATEKTLPINHPLRKTKEQSLVRRRKISVPELGPMTTVQEAAMDSPTIPGRPPIHERSISAPGKTWRHHMFGESMLSCIPGPALDEHAELNIPKEGHTKTPEASSTLESLDNRTFVPKSRSMSPRGPLSPRSLAPLVIPTSQSQRIPHHSSSSRLRNEFQRPVVPPKETRNDSSPYRSPYTPQSATGILSAIPTPQSAPEGRSSPKPWNTSTSHSPSPLGHSRGRSDASSIQTAGQDSCNSSRQHLGHRRGESEGSNSIINRGRPPRRRGDTNPSPMKAIPQRRSPSVEEQHAFATLPTGIHNKDAHALLSPIEFDTIRKQALGQANRFEVLKSKDVDALSRELRGLDERCEYLRKTHRSLRSGRRNLHDRICSYLRSPRVAKFSHESILKQEEALSELDTSIDDWVTKLEQAENRRTRIRQKLLEHVAAALIMQPSSPARNNNPLTSITRTMNHGENTPPRSPTKRETTSPQRVVGEVRVASPETSSRKGREVRSCHSIHVYADGDVYALLADVESEITRMSDLNEPAAQDIKKEIDDDSSATYTLSAATYESLPARTYTPPVSHRVAVRS